MEQSFSPSMEQFSHPFSDPHINRIGSCGVSAGKKIDNSFILLAMGLLLVYSWSQMYTVQANVFRSPEHSGIPNIRRILTS